MSLTVQAGKELVWQANHEDTKVITPSSISLSLSNGEILGENVNVTKAVTTTVNTSFATPFYKKNKIADHYGQLILKCKGGYSVEFRVYNDGVAYRFVTEKKGELIVKSENANFNFAGDYKAFIPYVNDMRGGERYTCSFESFFDEIKLSELTVDSLSLVPLLVDLGNGKKAAILESDVEDYPGMFMKINPNTRQGFVAELAPCTLEADMQGAFIAALNVIATKRADYLAKTEGSRTFPWRAVVISSRDADLANNDMAQKLAAPCRIADVSWIKPGKTSWDWWNSTNIYGVDFKAGMNTDTYKYFIDFSAENKLEYILIDAGWSAMSLMEVAPTLDLKELIDYGNKKNVGIILWSSWSATDREKEIVFPHYAAMGIKGFKVDFFDSDDQKMTNSMWDIVRLAADNKLLLDLHGMKPQGIHRTYPNVLNFEGVKGAENFRWSPIVNGRIKDDVPRYDVTVPYTRMLSGPMDYTPGAMKNATPRNFHTDGMHPMSQGTRVHQMAMYTVFEAPLQMLADSPADYKKEQETTGFIAKVPVVFDETVALDGEAGEYIVLARRKDNVWYVGAMTNWTKRTLTVDFSFLDGGNYEAEVFSDGLNADREATDYKREIIQLAANDKKEITMYPGGGWTARIYPAKK
ncbi:MAG: glycoside hydrolase family 97 protein [Tannerella sp.]|nr:glycoside hydrolase family 97 protein [Tannerella sp.]